MDKITFPLKRRMKRPQVADLQDALQQLLDRGALLAGDEAIRRELSGALKEERAKRIYGGTTAKLVGIFQQESGLQVSSEVDGPTAGALNVLLAEWGVLDRPTEPAEPRPFVVNGQVRHADGKPFSAKLVRAYDKDLRSEELLGEKITDQDGRYEIGYRAEQFRRAEKRSADLLVRVYDAENRELASSAVLFNAGPEETIDLIVGKDICREPSEYEQLLEAVKPLLEDLSPDGLNADDIGFLVGGTGEDRTRIVQLSTAFRLSRQTDLPPAVFYGFFRKNLPTDLPCLLAKSREGLRSALQNAMRDNIIPAMTDSEIDDVLRRMQVLPLQLPVFLVKPENLFGRLSDLRDLSTEQTDFINAKLNEHLGKEVLSMLGNVSEAMSTAAQSAAARLDYRRFRDVEMSTVIKDGILAELKRDPKLAEEAAGLEARLADRSSTKVADVLGLDKPLQNNPVLAVDIQRARTHEYARLVGLDGQAMKKLVEKSLMLDEASETALGELVREGTLSEEQKQNLQLTLELAKLTGNNLTFVSALKNENLKSVAEFVAWKKTDWQKLISDKGLPLPPEETPATYAENIALNIERTFPSQVLLNRVVGLQQFSQVNLLDTLDKLLANNDRLIEGTNPASLDWQEVDGNERERLDRALQDLTAFANTYRHMGVIDLINDQSLALEQKKSDISSRLQMLNTFHQNNPQLDLRLINFFDADGGSLNWNNISVSDRSLVRKQLMAYQRVLNLGVDTTDQQTLLSKGYDTALSIAGKTEEDFVNTCGLPLGKARMVYGKAQEDALSVSASFGTIQDVAKGKFVNTAVFNLDPKLINDLRAIDGFDDLFGSQDYCDCEECRSILSPAAYFVDLMYFIEKYISKPIFDVKRPNHSLYLKNRRSDLWKLQLTCENTRREIPYLTIVNEVLEKYLGKVILGNVYEKLSNKYENISFILPFSLPLEEIRLYLSHFSLTLSEIYRALKQTEEKVLRARLNLSQEEFAVITSPDQANVMHRFGNPASLANFPVSDFNNAGIDQRGFINLAGIARQQLAELLEMEFNRDLRNIEVAKMALPGELQNFPEILKNLTNDRLDFIHRFVRLWRKTSWRIPELDLVLSALKEEKLAGSSANAIDDKAVLNLARLADLQNKLGLTVEELCLLVHQLPVSKDYPKPAAKKSDQGLFERLFDLNELFGVDAQGQFKKNLEFHHYSFNKNDANDKKVDPKTPFLLAGLGISETELLLLLNLLKNEITFISDGDTKLNRSKISLLYRHARLAKALKLSIEDFIEALHLNFTPANSIVKTLEQIQSLLKFREWLVASPFTISELRFLLKGEESATVKYKMTSETVGKTVHDIQKSKEPKKLDALRIHLARMFNLSAKTLEDALKWVSIDINSFGIQAALNATFANDTTDVPNNPDDLKALLDLVRQLERVLLLFGNLKFKEETIAYLSEKPAALGITDLKNLQLDNLQSLTFLKILSTLGEEAEPAVREVMNSYLKTHNFSSNDLARLAELWQQDKSLIESLIHCLNFSAVPTEALEYLWECLSVCQTLGINGYSLQKLAEETDFNKLSIARDIVKGAFSSRYDDEKICREKLEPYLDRINVIKRDALCDYIIARQPDLKFRDWNDIYAFFLLDVEMSGCFRTSRVVAAISSLQLYVHRILMNLEQSASGKPVVLAEMKDVNTFKLEWEWRKNYRVWEANRKVFLYPENYLEPDLRDNKTPIFKELEDELLQQKITKETAEAAYRKHVSQFAELARLRIAGSYYHQDSDTYYFFGCTQQDPPQYYYRKWIAEKEWTPWEKIELAINAPYVSSEMHLGKLYLFWVEAKIEEKTKIEKGDSKPDNSEIKVDLSYSYLTENNRWIAPQRIELLSTRTDPLSMSQSGYYESVISKKYAKSWLRVYPDIVDDNIILSYRYTWFLLKEDPPYRYTIPCTSSQIFKQELDLFHNKLKEYKGAEINRSFSTKPLLLSFYESMDFIRLSIVSKFGESYKECEIDTYINMGFGNPNYYISESFPSPPLIQSPDWVMLFPSYYPLDLVHNSEFALIFTFNDQQYLIKQQWWAKKYFEQLASGLPVGLCNTSLREMIRLSTSLANDLGKRLFSDGLEKFLSLDTQGWNEKKLSGIVITVPTALSLPRDDRNNVKFQGAYGVYYRELFFDIPFLIANHLNANQKFEEAKWWYERIFDPTTSEPVDPKNPTERNWRYVEFRDLTVQKMKEILTDQAVIEQYKKNPFNPHAIARLRLNAYQKAIVMKYIDNLLDWGDDLFAQDTRESINEAMMLYVLAADILGKRPVKLGKCETVAEQKLTYEEIGPEIDKGSEFLIMLENWSWIYKIYLGITKTALSLNTAENPSGNGGAGAGTSAILSNGVKYNLMPYNQIVEGKSYEVESEKKWETAAPIQPFPGTDLVSQSTMAFCVPPNDDLLQYWDRVEDRLFKIRHCMNISGVRRQLALFQPSINPMLLVRAKAAGLSLADILAMVEAQVPPYRFSYLIEKAKQFTQTVQSFGSALLSALEKKDTEELTLLRSVHERNILRLAKETKKQQVRDAQYQYQAIVETQANVKNRIDYYQDLIDSGRNSWEYMQEAALHSMSIIYTAETAYHLLATICYLIPQLGSLFAMTFGGKQKGDSAKAAAALYDSTIKSLQAISASAGLETTFERREQEWEQQLLLAQQELKQVEQQRLAAEVRQLIAEKDLEIHGKNMEHADELHEFYKNKFSNLGLYNFLSTTLNRLYREAFNMAYDLARTAEKTYQLERDDKTFFITADNWQYDRAGLLAGERLLLQLQRMEKAYIEQNKRDLEVTQSFSLAFLDPLALVTLKQKGSCDIDIPEIMFNLAYPGQYKRIVKSVRITIPCVTGPYTNISATLRLTGSKVRYGATTNEADLIDLSSKTDEYIATSNAQNDGGLFELNFRDERYLPFEGAGAISKWNLKLPKIRLFDYDTISDVIIHINYTAKYNELLRTQVEDNIVKTFETYAKNIGLDRIFSLRHEFPNAFHNLMNPLPNSLQNTEFEVTKEHFPYFLADRNLEVSSVTVYLKPKEAKPIDTAGLTLKVNDSPMIANPPSWDALADTFLKKGEFLLSGSPFRKWKIDIQGSLGKGKLDDIFILVKYKIKV